MKKINIEGLEGKTLDFANAFNLAVDKIAQMELEAKKVDLSPLQAEINTLKENVKGTDFEAKFSKLEDAFTSRVNALETKMNTSAAIEVKTSVADAIVDKFAELEIKSLSDLNGKQSIHKVELELKADIATTALTGNVGRTQEVSPVRFAPIRPLAFIPKARKGTVTNGKSLLMWTPANYVANTGYAGEGVNAVTENSATATEKYRKMAKITAKQYLTAETFEDLPQFAQRLQEQLDSNAMLFLDKEILLGDGNDSTADQHVYGIIGQGSTAFDVSTVEKVAKPNVGDLADACATQAEINLYTVDTVWIHPKLANKLRRTKDTTGQYVINKLVDGSEVMGGLNVVRTTGIGSNALLVANSALIQLWTKRNLMLKIGQFHNDVELDRFTAILFARVQVLVEDEDKKGVIYVSDVAAALQSLEETV